MSHGPLPYQAIDEAIAIGQLRGRAVSCELWLRSRYGTWRFFRIAADRLIELGWDGLPLAETDGPGS